MGVGPFSSKKNCMLYDDSSSFATTTPAPAPNPNPSRWQILGKIHYANAYVLKVKYLDCTNFEGIKIMVYRGKYVERSSLDPHFSESSDSPIARFKPTTEGMLLAQELAQSL